MEYEFDVVGDMDLDHNLLISKSRCSALADAVIKQARRQGRAARVAERWCGRAEARRLAPAQRRAAPAVAELRETLQTLKQVATSEDLPHGRATLRRYW